MLSNEPHALKVLRSWCYGKQGIKLGWHQWQLMGSYITRSCNPNPNLWSSATYSYCNLKQVNWVQVSFLVHDSKVHNVICIEIKETFSYKESRAWLKPSHNRGENSWQFKTLL